MPRAISTLWAAWPISYSPGMYPLPDRPRVTLLQSTSATNPKR